MNKIFFSIVTFLLICLQIYSQNGKIISEADFSLQAFDTLYQRVSDGEGNLKTNYNYLAAVEMKVFFYESDGLKVKGYMAYPKDTSEKLPVIIYNRGGNREFGNLNEYKMTFIIAKAASWGYVVLASQYRGNDGGEGMEEFGGSDVNDVLNLVDVAKNIPFADEKNIGLYGWSRGGMMTYLALMKSNQFKAAAVGGAVTNLKEMDDKRGGEMGVYVYSELMPGYEKNKDSVMKIRSAIYHVDKLPKTTPMLLLHGTSDWRVIPEQSIKMVLELQKYKVPYRLIMFEGGDHGLSEFKQEVNDQVKAWFDKFLKNNQPLPNLEPHGR
ncbi:MAG: peptidase [Flavobacterium sp.]|nr:MAG: peptidase [Flavobacterium sp.]